jgi:hypothetical protein
MSETSASEVGGGGSGNVLHELAVRGEVSRVRRKCLGRFFLSGLRKGNGWTVLHTNLERRRAGALAVVLGLVVTCGGADGSANRWSGVGDDVVEGVGMAVVAVGWSESAR